MKINTEKTHLLCVSDSLIYKDQTFFDSEDGTIDSASETVVKILGFHVSSTPGVIIIVIVGP